MVEGANVSANWDGILQRQLNKQRHVGQNPRTMDRDQLAEYVRLNVLCAIKELTEVLDEIGWKPWATSQHFNREKFAREIADVQMFLDNLKLAILAPGEGQRWLTTEQLDQMFIGLMHALIDQCLERHDSGEYEGFNKDAEDVHGQGA